MANDLNFVIKNGLNVKEELKSAINILTSNNKLLLEILEYIFYNEPIVLDSETKIPFLFKTLLIFFKTFFGLSI